MNAWLLIAIELFCGYGFRADDNAQACLKQKLECVAEAYGKSEREATRIVASCIKEKK